MLLVVRLVSVGQGKDQGVCHQGIRLQQLYVELCYISHRAPMRVVI